MSIIEERRKQLMVAQLQTKPEPLAQNTENYSGVKTLCFFSLIFRQFSIFKVERWSTFFVYKEMYEYCNIYRRQHLFDSLPSLLPLRCKIIGSSIMSGLLMR